MTHVHAHDERREDAVLAIGALSRATEIYDPHKETWSAAGNLLEVRNNFTATLLADGRVIVVGGGNDIDYLASATAYPPAARSALVSTSGPR